MSQYVNIIHGHLLTTLKGENCDIFLNTNKETILQADIELKNHESMLMWGHIKSNKGFPIMGSKLELYKVKDKTATKQQTADTDLNGFYAFENFTIEEPGIYKIAVYKPVFHGKGKAKWAEPCLESTICLKKMFMGGKKTNRYIFNTSFT